MAIYKFGLPATNHGQAGVGTPLHAFTMWPFTQKPPHVIHLIHTTSSDFSCTVDDFTEQSGQFMTALGQSIRRGGKMLMYIYSCHDQQWSNTL